LAQRKRQLATVFWQKITRRKGNPCMDLAAPMGYRRRAMSKTAQNNQSAAEPVDFGFRKVAREEKQAMVRGVFDAVADKYDVMNDLMSGGLHRLWKARMIEALHIRPRSAQHLIDMAGGTGDIALRAQARAQKLGAQLSAHIIDANSEMMKAGQKRAAVKKAAHLHFTTGTGEAMPVPDQCADMVSIAFGIRNITHRDRALREAYRVLKPGGRFVCLEFSHMPGALLQKIYDAYSFNVIPPMSGLVTGERDAYQYLVESIRRFPSADDFLSDVEQAGFARAQYEQLSGGVAALHMGWRL
jgi:demethylmenaquinone methyltransferase/2-methoxy-6-polyprenyl-1,4-benzoquinol methylase